MASRGRKEMHVLMISDPFVQKGIRGMTKGLEKYIGTFLSTALSFMDGQNGDRHIN